MEENEKILFHIIWATHNSRVSERMKKYSRNKGLQPFVLNDLMELEITTYISEIVIQDNLKVPAFNICRDHVHVILFCEINKRDNIVRKLKGKSTQLYKENNKINVPFHLWAQKNNYTIILSDDQLSNTYEYVKHNRIKHNLPQNTKLEQIIEKMITPYDSLLN